MKVTFTKMQGAGNDFVVLDETRERLHLTTAQYRFLADRHFGVGADQILSIRPAPPHASDEIDFSYAIHNANGQEVEHCGNGARCFVRYVSDKGLTHKTQIKVQTVNRCLSLMRHPDGTVTVDMGAPEMGAQVVAFNTQDLGSHRLHDADVWTLALPDASVDLVLVSMGNPHAVQCVDDVALAPVHQLGPWVSQHTRFAHGVNAGFMQIVNRQCIHLRVFERGAGETLACGTGACAAVVAGIAQGLLDSRVDVHTQGGKLSLQWDGPGHSVLMTGPATFVFDGVIELPDL